VEKVVKPCTARISRNIWNIGISLKPDGINGILEAIPKKTILFLHETS
jgi:hypothetical protein